MRSASDSASVSVGQSFAIFLRWIKGVLSVFGPGLKVHVMPILTPRFVTDDERGRSCPREGDEGYG